MLTPPLLCNSGIGAGGAKRKSRKMQSILLAAKRMILQVLASLSAAISVGIIRKRSINI